MIPGPTILMVIAQGLNHGPKSVLPLIMGTGLGNLLAMSLSFIGLGALMSASAVMFGALKWLGAAYLVYLGIGYWRAPVESLRLESGLMDAREVFRDSFIVTALNPKSIVFFVMLLPLFIDDSHPVLVQMMIMSVSFIVVSGLTVLIYGVFSSYIHDKLKSPLTRKWLNRTGGSLLMGAGALTAMMQR
ncbi:LysE family translocator [Endozoicomonas euniceicola]|uniref:LysE family translocator n=1 Tax=Endozoicomonas euniceicola TaxID=1234143 RepID=A0ABY6H1D2_9GAMM|nr:LysE family translocator [Endozoicomonas euniceicola]UYM18875.1 LysE family translocator [Endozoicomonas euniceicola]